jgi:glycosyltransferase involved in cell wall biosynthesis
MKVAFDARSLAAPVLRGWDRYTIALASELVRRGISVTFFHRARQPLHAGHVHRIGCEVCAIDDVSGVHWEQVAVPLALARGKFDVYHAPAETGVPFAAPCPVVLTLHSATFASYRDLVHRGLLPGSVDQYVGAPPARRHVVYHENQIRRADHILTPSEFSRGEIVSLLSVPAERVTVTPLAVDEQFLRSRRAPADIDAALAELGVRRPYLLYVGGYEPHKNVPGLLEVFARVRAVQPDLSLVAVGSKLLPPELPAKAIDLGLRPGQDVTLLSNLGSELTDLYDGAALLVTMSWRETFCLPALEAMTRGVAVVGSEWGALPEVVGDVGGLVDPRNIPQAADAILAALQSADDPATSAAVRRRAAMFDWRRTAELTIDVYSRLTDGRRPRPASILRFLRRERRGVAAGGSRQ